MIHAL